MIIVFLITTVVFLVLDGLWLGLVAPRFYKAQLGHLMAEKVNFAAAGVFYVIYIVALLFFIIYPAVKKGEPLQALWQGALLGFAMYATYDLTNLATLRDWPLLVTLVDLAWGTAVTAACSYFSTLATKALQIKL